MFDSFRPKTITIQFEIESLLFLIKHDEVPKDYFCSEELFLEGNLHALLLVLTILAGFALCWRFFSFTKDIKGFALRLLGAVFAFVSISFLAPMPFLCFCGPGNNPSMQAFIPACFAALLILFTNGIKHKIIYTVLALFMGVGLSWQFHRLVHPEDTSKCTYTGSRDQFISNSCELPSTAERVWHTPLTGLFLVKVKDPNIPISNIVQTIIDHNSLQSFLHPELKERIPLVLSDHLIGSKLKLKKFGQDVKIVKDSSAKGAFIRFTHFKCHSNYCNIAFEYKVEGVTGATGVWIDPDGSHHLEKTEISER